MTKIFDSHEFNRIVVAAGKEHDWSIQHLPSVHGFARPWFHRASSSKTAPVIYISAGIHGDEPAGSWAAAELLQHPDWFKNCDAYVFPLLNPAGMQQGVRENADGVDLNRDYLNPRSVEARDHIAVLDRLPLCHVYLHLHEDWEATGAYLYAVHSSSEPDAVPALLAAMGRHLPIEPAEEIDGYAAKDGVIRRDEIPERDDWPEGFYMAHQHRHYHGYTLETPSAQPIERRIAAHVAAARALVEFARDNEAALTPAR